MEILCPVCGKYRFAEDGDWRWCEVCGWQNDSEQNHDATKKNGVNELSLAEYRILYQKLSSDDPATREKAAAEKAAHQSARRKIHEEYTGSNCSIIDAPAMQRKLDEERTRFLKAIGEL